MEQSGAILREVGTTNRTRLADYENAINEKTRVLLRVHPSNFKVTGFTDKPSLEELVSLSQRSRLPLVEDLGSGCLVDLSEQGVSEPTVKQSVDAGVSAVMFSGDKLLGGPQAGIIAGKKDLIDRVRRYPLFRALRVDKLTIAALEATLGAYLCAAWDEIPTMRMIRMTPQEVKRRAENFIRELRPNFRSMKWRSKSKMHLSGRRRLNTFAIITNKNHSDRQRALFGDETRTASAPRPCWRFRYRPRGR